VTFFVPAVEDLVAVYVSSVASNHVLQLPSKAESRMHGRDDALIPNFCYKREGKTVHLN
jgi:hypothetical protein